MADRHSPGVRRRRLSAALRALRADSGRTAAEVAAQLSWSAGKLTRIERNEWRRPSARDVGALLDAYGVDGDERAHLLGLVQESRDRSEWRAYQDLFWGPLPEFEAEAVRIRTYGALVVPGLLQTPEYAAAVFRGGQIMPDGEIASKVEARMARRRVLDAPDGPPLHALIDEAALWKAAGSVEVMVEQLRYLAGMAAHYNVTILVVPNSAGVHPAVTGAFSLIDFPHPEPGIVTLSNAVGSLYVEDPAYVARYTLVYDYVQGVALSPTDSLALISRIAEELSK
ncbi:helix-turn-helix domain-containing protein [Marinitenerispora sediminis]|uniref:Transcriptional regulator n=1 Tax=Marinitenerispora sediminis TaxID=1931232 RepID=A0A368T7P3_9ACTN|nr:helix-turn-helix transcriptional regulator [Marinitenerispora sediminis]RCV51168.1 transcriptional regulator [Marinitenerispora sediminis]RCV57073.1 transcriptional regulator [Marinitenerispora sediminis]RCV59962.1 transcriptional regulator [Marinitenerispora sediminis]